MLSYTAALKVVNSRTFYLWRRIQLFLVVYYVVHRLKKQSWLSLYNHMAALVLKVKFTLKRFLQIRMWNMWLWHRFFFPDAQSSKTTKLLAFKVLNANCFWALNVWKKNLCHNHIFRIRICKKRFITNSQFNLVQS